MNKSFSIDAASTTATVAPAAPISNATATIAAASNVALLLRAASDNPNLVNFLLNSGNAAPSAPTRTPSPLPIRAPGAKTFPCRARCMPESHNYSSALLTVTPHTTHGEGLVCSFPACRDGGIKFVYCLHCEQPVSKRLFRGKHKYCTPASNDKTRDSASDKEMKKTATRQADTKPPPSSAVTTVSDKRIFAHSNSHAVSSGCDSSSAPSILKKKRRYSADNRMESKSDGSSSPPHKKKTKRRSSPSPSDNKKKKKRRSLPSPSDKRSPEDVLVDAYLQRCEQEAGNSQVERWITMLRMRPELTSDDDHHLSAWLRAVVHVSGDRREG